MLKTLAIGAALAVSVSASLAQTAVGDATLIDTATVVNGTVTPGSFLTYVSGGNGQTGTANGTSYAFTPGVSPATAMASADHAWLQFEAVPIIMHSDIALGAVIAIPAIDHGWTLNNSGPGSEPWEPFEFRIYGCATAVFTANCEIGHVNRVWTRGVDDAGASKNADDFTTQWAFTGQYNYFAISEGDRLVGGPFSAGEGEIDALAAAPIPEPETYALFAAGLAALGFVTRRKRKQR
jgi:PEP-CTERM motif